MRKIIFLLILFKVQIFFGQNVNIQISNFSLKHNEVEYSTFQFVNSSYSISRPTLVVLTNNDLFLKFSNELSSLYKFKQEYTDIWILGITNLSPNELTFQEKEVIDLFLKEIIKYRSDNNLSHYTLESLESEKIILRNKDEICKYLICKNKFR
ncbi:hypothetical protein [Flavobacterium sp.]|mgnify:CR=1 FL=1|uniref:hypothetical protein n=1 Tax=Flavobacterium sp. TaxID=239 RepID=UPI002FDC9CDA